jgi:hypothetical protein
MTADPRPACPACAHVAHDRRRCGVVGEETAPCECTGQREAPPAGTPRRWTFSWCREMERPTFVCYADGDAHHACRDVIPLRMVEEPAGPALDGRDQTLSHGARGANVAFASTTQQADADAGLMEALRLVCNDQRAVTIEWDGYADPPHWTVSIVWGDKTEHLWGGDSLTEAAAWLRARGMR